MSRVRVLEVLGSSGGGVIRHVRSLAAGLADAGDDVVVAGPGRQLDDLSSSPPDRSGAGHPITVEDVPIADRPRPGQDLRAVRSLRRLSADRDLVHAHGLRAGALAVLAVRSRRRRDRRPRLAVTLHNLPVGGGLVAAVSGVLERVVARGADVVLGVSPDLVDRARSRGARRVVLALVPAPVSEGDSAPSSATPGATRSRRAAVRAELAVADGDALVVAVARLAPQKGLDLLTDVLALLKDRPATLGRVRAVIAGDGPLRSRLESEVAARGLPLRLLGHRDDVPSLFAAADVVVLTSVWEGQSLAVQEALRAGAALVATDVGGTRAVTGDGAALVPRTDPATTAGAFAAEVGALLDDPQKLRDLRQRAAQRARALPTEADAVRQIRALG